MGQTTSPKYRGRANQHNLAGRGQYARPGKRERAEQKRHRVLQIPAPTADISYPCQVPGCTCLTPLRERESWKIKIGHFGPIKNPRFPHKSDKPMLWISFTKTVDGCPDCWIKVLSAVDGKGRSIDFLDDGYDAKKAAKKAAATDE